MLHSDTLDGEIFDRSISIGHSYSIDCIGVGCATEVIETEILRCVEIAISLVSAIKRKCQTLDFSKLFERKPLPVAYDIMLRSIFCTKISKIKMVQK